VLCIHTALHLNIPPGNASTLSHCVRKAKWIAIGIFAPEIVVYVAWGQRQHVKDLSEDLARIFKKKAQRRHEWTTTHSWFAYMGGFAIDTKQGCEDLPGEYIEGSPRLFLGCEAVCILARLGWLPDISREAIRDKSKADALAKVLVITQAGWMILQCIMRFVYKLPVTALELNTLAHAVCALLVYALWWEKPLDVSEPTLLIGDWAPGLATAFSLCNRPPRQPRTWSRANRRRSTGIAGLRKTEIDSLFWVDKLVIRNLQEQFPASSPTDDEPDADYSVISLAWERGQPGHESRKYRSTKPLSAPGIRHAVGCNGSSKDGVAKATIAQLRGVGVSFKTRAPLNVSLTDLLRWQLFRGFMYDFPEVAPELFLSGQGGCNMDQSIFPTLTGRGASACSYIFPCGHDDDDDDDDTEFEKISGHSLGRYRIRSKTETGRRLVSAAAASNWPSLYFGRRSKTRKRAVLMSLGVFWAVALVYGAIHTAAWNDHFPTVAEATAWKVSCIYVPGYGCIFMGAVTLRTVLDMYSQMLIRLMPAWLDKVLKRIDHHLSRSPLLTVLLVLVAVLFVVSLVFYAACRVFLVIEAFISIRSLPRGAFQTPGWTQFLAHL